MTNLEALQACVANYTLANNVYLKALIDRSLTSTDTYTGKSQAFDLATADVYVVLATSANVSEGGYSISMSERSSLLKSANAIYERCGYPSISEGSRKVKAVNPW